MIRKRIKNSPPFFKEGQGVVLMLLVFMLNYSFTYAQSQTSDQKAFQLLDKAMGQLQQDNAGIVFEGIAYGLKDPKSIFKMPATTFVKGGYLYARGDKYEMYLGAIKGLCDGKLLVLVDEISKTMYVDSVRHKNVPDSLAADVNNLLNETLGKGTLSYQGTEALNGKSYHKIKSEITGTEVSHVYYWVDAQNGQLLLMAEHQNNAYDAYWFKSIGKAPENYEYSINIPKKEIENYYGYSVIDNRFMNESFK